MIRKIFYLGNSILRQKCKPVKEITPEIQKIGLELVQTLQAHNGLGLAAPQIGYSVRMFAIQISDNVDQDGYGIDQEPMVFINPEITFFSDKRIKLPEACISIPEFHEEVWRSESIDVKATLLDGTTHIEKGLKRWRARCIQHEVDHLDGILYIDRMTKELRRKHEKILHNLEHYYKSLVVNH